MKTITISAELTEDSWANIVAACAFHFRYEPRVLNPDFVEGEDHPSTLPNPQSREEFALDRIREKVIRPAIAQLVAEHKKAQVGAQIDAATKEAANAVKLS